MDRQIQPAGNRQGVGFDVTFSMGAHESVLRSVGARNSARNGFPRPPEARIAAAG